MNRGIRVLQTLALPLGYVTRTSFILYANFSKKSTFIFKYEMLTQCVSISSGAGNEARTRYLHLGKVALYQMRYARRWCPEPESNQRHGDFQSPALPTELSGQIFFRAGMARPGNFNPKRDPRDGIPSHWIWRPGTGSNRRPLA